MKNILIIQGGGRSKGNTAQLVEHFIKGAEEAGHKTELVSLLKNEVKGCLGCNACRYGKPCIQKDSFNEIVPKIKNADCIVFASPLYFWTVSSRIKAFIERFYCIAEEDTDPPLGRYEKYPVKDCALLMTSADNFFWTFEQAVSYYQFTLVNYIGFHDKGMLLAGGCGDTNGRPQIDKTDYLRQAYEFGKKIYRDIMRISVYENFPVYAKEIREEVFVKEQGFQHEFDQMDDTAIHIVMFDEDEIPAATCRVFWDEEMDSYVLGRLAVIKKHRGKNIGAVMVKEAEKYVKKKGGKAMAVHAQCRVADFYKKLGFTEFGSIENDEGCPHVWMKKII